MSSACKCEAIGKGVQTFRVRWLTRRFLFRRVAHLGGIYEQYIGSRQVWQCRRCGQMFAVMRIPFNDEEEILVRAESPDWAAWDWGALADIAGRCRWRGPSLDERYVA
jgi:hypothetical protein